MRPFLQSIFTLSLLCVVAHGADTGPVIETRALDPDGVIPIPTAPGITTTLEFPGPIEGINGFGLTAQPEAAETQSATFAVAHSPGTRFISISPLRTDSSTNINIIYQERTYVFVARSDLKNCLFKMRLTDPIEAARKQAALDEARLIAAMQKLPKAEERATLALTAPQLLGLIDKAKAFVLLKYNDPKNVEDLRRLEKDFHVSVTPNYSIKPLAITRKGAWDALVFEIAITNKTSKPLYYDPEGFLVAVGSRTYEARTADASGEVPANGSSMAYLAIQGDHAQGSNNIDPDNDWLITLRELTEGPSVLPPLIRPESSVIEGTK